MKKKLLFLIVVLVLSIPAVFELSHIFFMDMSSTDLSIGIAEQFSIMNVTCISNNSAVVTVENTGGNSSVYTVVFVSASINGLNATLTPSGSPSGILKAGVTANFTVTLQGNRHFISDNTYKFLLNTIKGTVADYTVTYINQAEAT
jgi:hypothetical protein